MKGVTAYSLKIFLLAVVYFLAGKLALLLAIPPGFATPVWPAAGVALAAILLWGYRFLPGVLLGSFSTNVLIAAQGGADITSFMPILVAAGIAVGATVQAALGCYLIKRAHSIPTRLERAKELLALLLRGGVIACLVNSILGPLVLLMVGVIPASIYLVSAFTWWVGDMIGVILFVPMLLLLANTDVSNIRKAIVAIPILVFTAIAVFTFFDAKEDQLNKKQRAFEVMAQDIGREFEKDIEIYLGILSSIERFIHASSYVSSEEFDIFTHGFLKQYPGIQSLSWNRKVTDSKRVAFEKEIRQQGFPDYVIKDRFSSGETIPASKREVYFPVTYVAPYANNEATHGFDTYGTDDMTGDRRRQALNQARDEARSITTGRISLLQAEDEYGLLIYHPVYRNDLKSGDVVQRRKHLIGYTAGVFVMPTMLSSVQKRADRTGVDVVLRDLNASDEQQLLYDSRTPNHKEPAEPITIPDAALRAVAAFEIAGEQWQLEFIQKNEIVIADQGWGLWYLLIGGLLLSAVFGVFLIIISANTEAVQKEVEEESDEGIDLNFSIITKIAGGFASLLGLIVLLGWHARSDLLIQIHASFAPMQYNTALGFFLSGIGIMSLARQGAKSVLIGGLAVAVIGVMTLFQYLLGTDFGIDQLFMEHYVTTSTSHPGRMAPNTALCFALLGIALIGHFFLRTRANGSVLLRLLGSMVFIFGVAALVGYMTELEAAYGWMRYTQMALHTAIGFIVLGAGLIVCSWMGKTLRWESGSAVWFSGIAAAIVMLFSIALWQQFNIQEQKLVKARVSEEIALMSQSIHNQMGGTVLALKRMAQRWEKAEGTVQQQWLADARSYRENFSALTTVEWVDSTYHIRWVEPLEGNEKAVGLNIAFNEERRRALKSAEQENTITLTPPINLVQGYLAFMAYLPIHYNGDFDGFMVGIYDARTFFKKILPEERVRLFNIEIMDEEEILFKNYNGGLDQDELAIQETLTLFNRNWKVNVSPTPEFLAQQASSLATIVLLMGVLFSLIVGFAVYTSIMYNWRSSLLQKRTLALYENEIELRRVSEKLGLILDNAGEGIYGLDMNEYTTFANNAAIEMLGYSMEEMRGVTQHSLIHHHYPDGKVYPREQCNIYQALREGKAHTEDTEVFWRKDGTPIPVEYTSKPIINSQGEISGAVIVFRDISERKQIDKMKNEFISTVNHEIRTPLTSIQGSLGLLKTRADTFDSKSKRLIELSYNNCQRLSHLVNDILDMEKIAAGKMEYYIEETELCHFVDDIVDRHQSYAEKYNIRFNIRKEVKEVYCNIDANRFNQALVNLLSNAAKFSPAGGVVDIIVFMQDNKTVRISVSDNGPGIPRSFREKIFEKFEQADGSSARAKGGTGLGLSITKSIIEAFGGTVAFDTEEGKGTTFYFVLPVCASAASIL